MLWELLACQPQGSWRQRGKKSRDLVAYQFIHLFFHLCLCVKPIMTQNNPIPCFNRAYSLVESIEVNSIITLTNILLQMQEGYENVMYNRNLFSTVGPRKVFLKLILQDEQELARQRGIDMSFQQAFTQTALCWEMRKGQCGQRPLGDKEMDTR